MVVNTGKEAGKYSMRILKLNLQRMDEWVDGLIRKQRVIAVQAKNDRFAFAALEKASNLRLDYDVTISPPKCCFQPAREDLFAFSGPAAFENVIDDQAFVLIGVHPYDMVAINQMDQIFSSVDSDVHYMTRRAKATIVVCDVQNASANVFAGCMETATVDKGFDVLLTGVGNEYVVESKTDKGKTLLADIVNKAPEADALILRRREQVWEDNRKFLRKHDLRVELKKLPALLSQSEDHPVWAEKAERCFSCGSCNLVCPTCYCFDMQDEVAWDLKSGTRYRTWDGCMLKDFATVAGGHNFRKSSAERYRHRYFRKGKYIPDKIGQIACVGCGRCITACVTKIANPVEIYNRLLEPG